MKLSEQVFRKVNLATLIAVYSLILVGGVVRASGSGMGCPDWPRCFGNFYPPRDVTELPADYKQQFLNIRLEKNQRLATSLRFLGLSAVAESIESDPDVVAGEEFDVRTAWTEYINRLVGVLIGIFVMATAFTAKIYWRHHRSITYLAFCSLVLVVFIGWTGSLVVSTNLFPGFVTFHMGLSLILVAILIYMQERTSNKTAYATHQVRNLSFMLFVLFAPQVLLGTQVRENVDHFIVEEISRTQWMTEFDWRFYFHRSYSIFLLALAFWTFRKVKNEGARGNLLKTIRMSLYAMIFAALTGAAMTYFSFPAFIQPLHLLAGSILFGLLFYLFLLTNRRPSTY